MFDVAGWAFKDGVGLRASTCCSTGASSRRRATAIDYDGLQQYWKISTDPQHPRVGFSAAVDLRGVRGIEAGQHWLGLRLHGRDGSVEDWPEQPIEIGGAD